MRILLDECVPPQLLREFHGCDIQSVLRIGWAGRRNGVLLRSMLAEGYDILVTSDKNLRYQQNLRAVGIAVVLLSGGGNRLSDLIPLVPAAIAAFASIRPGQFVEITG